MRIHRMISILLMVEARGKVKAKVLAEAFETSVRTIYRDVDTLCEAGIPLMAETGPNGGIRFVDGYHVDLKQMNTEDITSLYLNGMGIKAERQSELNIKLMNALHKLDNAMPKSSQGQIELVRRQFYFDEETWWGQEKRKYDPDVLVAAVRASRKLDIAYENREGIPSKRCICPYGIVVSENMWYLIALCEKSGEVRSFRCDRIVSCCETTDYFSVPEHFDLGTHWQDSKNQFKQMCAALEAK